MIDNINLSPIHVSLASDDRGTVGLAVAVYSLLRHTQRPVHVWIIEDGISRATQRRLQTSWSGAPNLAHVRFFSMRELPVRLPGWWSTNNWPRAAMARFQLAEILPTSVSRCIYIDIDVLVGTDVGTLFDQDMVGLPLGMVDGSLKSDPDRKYFSSIGLDPDRYGNSGVLLMDIDAWRLQGVASGLINLARVKAPAGLWFFDQDLLNIYFKDRWFMLDGRWNKRDAGVSPAGFIQHFAGAPKPWQMSPATMKLDGLAAWERTRLETGFTPAPPSLRLTVARKVDNSVGWIWRQVRKRIARTSGSLN